MAIAFNARPADESGGPWGMQCCVLNRRQLQCQKILVSGVDVPRKGCMMCGSLGHFGEVD
jgi:hypothetical protein